MKQTHKFSSVHIRNLGNQSKLQSRVPRITKLRPVLTWIGAFVCLFFQQNEGLKKKCKCILIFGNFNGSKFRDNSLSFYSGLQLELFSFSGVCVILGSAFSNSQGQFPSEQTAEASVDSEIRMKGFGPDFCAGHGPATPWAQVSVQMGPQNAG